MINSDNIKNSVALLQTDYDGSPINQYSRYKAVILLERWIKQLTVFANLPRRDDISNTFYDHLWDIISGYQMIVDNEKTKGRVTRCFKI